MDFVIIDGKRYNADEVADMIFDTDDFEMVGIPNNGDLSDDEKELEDDGLDDMIDENQISQRVRNRAETSYAILEDGAISDVFLNNEELEVSVPEASGISVPDVATSMQIELPIVSQLQEPSSPPRKRNKMLISSTPVPPVDDLTDNAATGNALSDQNNKLGHVREECCKYKDIVVDITSNDFERARWKKGNLQLYEEQITFLGNSKFEPELADEFATPYSCFKYFFTNELMAKIVDETIHYAKVEKNNQTFFFDALEFGKYVGIIYYMSYHKLPCVRDYWNKQDGVDAVRNVMTVNRFEKIREYLHINNNNEYDAENPDRLFKIRPMVNSLNDRFHLIPMLPRLSIDEQMCSTKVGHYMKQYLPNKPKKWGFKFFAICDTTGFMYKFEIYTGEAHPLWPGEPDLKASANIVVRMTREVPRFKNYIVYMDNYYTSIPLLIYLRTLGIHSIGTINRNRIKNCKLPDPKVMMKLNRGVSVEFTTDIQGVELTTISWKDNKVVNLVSTFVGMKPLLAEHSVAVEVPTVERWDKKHHEVITIPCPQIIKEYNLHMGGVDLMDSSLGRLKIGLKSRKWYIRIFYHLLDVCMVNAWLLFKRANPSISIAQKKFRLEVSYVLRNMTEKKKKGSRPDVPLSVPRAQTEHKPPNDLRHDGMDHLPVIDGRARCKNSKCGGEGKQVNNRSIFKCAKCNVHLCLNDKRNCFVDYHTKTE